MAKNQKSYAVARGLFSEGENASPNEQDVVKSEIKNEMTTPLKSTQGRKGQKLRRMNLPVTDEEYEIIRRGSRASGMTYGEYVYAAVKFYQENGGGIS